MNGLAALALFVPALAALVLTVQLLRCARRDRRTLGRLVWTHFGRVDGKP